MTESIEELELKKGRLVAEISEVERELANRRGIPLTTKALKDSRAYAFDANSPISERLEGCVNSLARYGFCVVDNVIPRDQICDLKQEAEKAEKLVEKNSRQVVNGLKEGKSLDELAKTPGIELRPVRRVGYSPKIVNDIVWLPKYAKFLAHPSVTSIARAVLDDHLKIAQLHLRHIAAASEDGDPGGFFGMGRSDLRDWHTVWPHDLMSYGAGNPQTNVGSVRQPFPDVTLGLTMIWFLTDVDEDSGATYVVPGSHRDLRNPRGPNDGMSVTSPVSGDMQVTAKAGSVFIQDSRLWHASPMHNTDQKRIAVVNRWSPWWIAVDDYAPGGVVNTVCRPLSQREYDALPEDLKPMMRHLCPTEKDTLQQLALDKAEAAKKQAFWGFDLLDSHPEKVASANKHIEVKIRAD